MDGNTRRLPPWMIAGTSSGVADTSNPSDDKHEPDVPKTKVEKRPRRSTKPKEKADESEEPKKVGIKRKGRGRRLCRQVEEEQIEPNIGDGDNKPVTYLEDEDFTADDLLSFAQEYVKGEEDETREDGESLSTSESMVVEDISNIRSSQDVTKEPNADDMLSLILGPFFKKS